MVWANFLKYLGSPPPDYSNPNINPESQERLETNYINETKGELPLPTPADVTGLQWRAWGVSAAAIALITLDFGQRPMSAAVIGVAVGGALAYGAPLLTLVYAGYGLGFGLAMAIGNEFHLGMVANLFVGVAGAYVFNKLYFMHSPKDLAVGSQFT